MAATEEKALVERATTLFDILKNDHQTVSKIVEELKKAPLNEMEGLLAQLDNQIVVHAQAEESYIYPRFSEHTELAEIMRDALADHDFIRDLLQKMQSVQVESGRWFSELEALEERFSRHIAMEEQQLFPRAAEIFPENELNLMKEQVLADKAKRPVPHRHRDGEPPRRQM